MKIMKDLQREIERLEARHRRLLHLLTQISVCEPTETVREITVAMDRVIRKVESKKEQV